MKQLIGQGESLKNYTKYFSSYGDLVFSSDQIKICEQDKIQEYTQYFNVLGLLLEQCATLETTINLNTKLLTNRKIFEVGFQNFENAKIICYPDASIQFLSTETKLNYDWISCEDEMHNSQYKTKYKLLNFVKLKYSWRMAAAKCQESGMTLPHLENEKRTKELISYILNEYALPAYVMFFLV